MCFKHNRSNQFITSGAQHLSLWTYEAEMITFQSFDIQHLHTTFMTLLDTEEYTVTGCSAGSIYVWNELILIYTFKVH